MGRRQGREKTIQQDKVIQKKQGTKTRHEKGKESCEVKLRKRIDLREKSRRARLKKNTLKKT